MRKITNISIVLTLLFSVVLSGCGSTDQTSTDSKDSPSNREIVVAMVTEPDSVDVHKTSSIEDATEPLYETLFKRDKDGNIVPNLVEEYSMSSDGKEGTFKLKTGLEFHSGKPVNAEAVKKSFERMMAISPFNSNLGTVEGIDVVDENTFKIRWAEPYAPFFSNATSEFLAPLDVSVLDRQGEGFEKNPSASGPLELVEIKRGDSLVYKPNEKADWGEKGAPGFDKVTFRFIPDDETRLLEFKKGTVNVLLNVPIQYVEELEKEPGVTLERVPDYVLNYLGWNNKLPIFQDVRVRQAIALAVDREPIIQTTMRGEAKPVFGPLPSVVFGYSQTIEDKAKEKYAHNVEKAKQLLAEAGWSETNANGIVMKDGKPFSVDLWVTNEPAKQRAAQIIQNQLKEVGIEVKIAVKESAAIIEQTPKGAHQMILWTYGWFDADVMYFLLFGKGRSTRLHYEVDELDHILQRARVETDTKARLKLYEEAQEFLLEQTPFVPLFVRESITATRGLEKFEMHPISNAIQWKEVEVGQ
ncbi:ABC transporter substrate-binding protein [Ammoniphilus sp. CFH 90114]|uniref:ABC transporter substrate-binding protein n=1 Tax=Ammoniphilus sp. CFH 90114 TaxID=2493665 RepID=UPI0013E97991|nr:ABC transporter substrate-binding protein [Ammoniphilus sp. CFH 90114]